MGHYYIRGEPETSCVSMSMYNPLKCSVFIH